MTPRRDGFTLVEVVLVVAIVGIIAAIAVPRYSSTLAHLRVDHAAQRIVADLDLARRTAQSTSSSRKVTFNSVADSYNLSDINRFNSATDTYSVDLTDSPYHTPIQTVTLGAGSIITFDGYGKPDVGGTIVVGTTTYQRTVTVDANTGRAQVQ